MCRSAGLEWSIQDGVRFLQVGKAIEGALAIEVNANTGMVGSPLGRF